MVLQPDSRGSFREQADTQWHEKKPHGSEKSIPAGMNP
jgi:hypothetical protein